jgi:hypothetical protein
MFRDAIGSRRGKKKKRVIPLFPMPVSTSSTAPTRCSPSAAPTVVIVGAIQSEEQPKLFSSMNAIFAKASSTSSAFSASLGGLGVVRRMGLGYARMVERRPFVYSAAAAQPLSISEIFCSSRQQPIEVIKVVSMADCTRSYRLEIELIADMLMLFEPFDRIAVDQKVS